MELTLILQQIQASPIGSVFTISVCTYLANLLTVKGFKKVVTEQSLHARYFKHIIRFGIILLGILAMLYSFEETKQLTSVLLASGGLLVGILGFAAQESLTNIINGLFLSVFKPFKIGDRINLYQHNMVGFVEDISLRHTVLRTFNNNRIIVPNSMMNKGFIENNHYKDPVMGNYVDVTISYQSDLNLALKLIEGIVVAHPSVVDPRTPEKIAKGGTPFPLFVKDFSDNGITIRAMVWSSDVIAGFYVASDIRVGIKDAFDQHGIEFAHQQVRVKGIA